MIENKRVRNVDIHLTGIHHGSTFYIAKKVSEVEQDKLKTIGLPTNLRPGIKILGRSIGPVSRYNVYLSRRFLKKHVTEKYASRTGMATIITWTFHTNDTIAKLLMHQRQNSSLRKLITIYL